MGGLELNESTDVYDVSVTLNDVQTVDGPLVIGWLGVDGSLLIE